MRLLHTRDLRLRSFFHNFPPYAILSHCWEEEEVVFSDLTDLAAARRKKGFAKIEKTCAQAIKDGFDYCWIDTCCIDKSSSSELSESINSMFRWYRDAAVCYAFLEDVEGVDDLHGARWFTRAWTLQELLAPDHLIFYNKNWLKFSSKFSLSHKISDITGIDERILSGSHSLGYTQDASIAKRMSWAANRQATREEDVAYSLLGLFDVNMPLLYGEGGSKAFMRLQEEAIKTSLDQSFLTWLDLDQSKARPEHGASFLASHPRYFRQCIDVRTTGENVPPFAINNSGLQMRVPLHKVPFKRNRYIAVLSCYLDAEITRRIGILLEFSGDDPSHCQRVETEKLHIVSEDEFRAAQVRDCCILRKPPGQSRIRLLSIRTTGTSITRGKTLCLTSSGCWRNHPVQRRLIEIASVQEAGHQVQPRAFGVGITAYSKPLRMNPKIFVRIDINDDGVRPLSAYCVRVSLLPLIDEYHHDHVNLPVLPLLPPTSTTNTKHSFASLQSNYFGNIHASISWENMANRDVLILKIGTGSSDPKKTLIRRMITSLSHVHDGVVTLLSQLALTVLIANAVSYHKNITSIKTAAPIAQIHLLVWLSISPARLTTYTFTRWTFTRYALGASAITIAFQDDWILHHIFHSTNSAWHQIIIGLLVLINCYFFTTILCHILTIYESTFNS